MPAKLATTINKIQAVPNPTNAEIIGQLGMNYQIGRIHLD
jgi:hypothetical protein